MSDLPPQGVLQQAHAHRISGEHLEVLGKQAASKWASGESKTLSDAVVATVKQAGLSPEQVKRVCEFANTEAYLTEFKKEGANHRFIDFGTPGPANPSEVLKDLNDGGGGTVFDDGYHYELPPTEKRAHAEPHIERALEAELSRTESPMLQANPYGEVMELKDKLAAACDQLGAEISSLELQYADAADRTYQQVKQATLGGTSLGKIVQAWQSVAPSGEHVKVAFQLFTPRLMRELVFTSVEDIGDSLLKTAEAGAQVNEAHPLVLDFNDFCQTLTKLAETRQAKEEARGHLNTLTGFLKEASAGEMVGRAARGAYDAAKGVSRFAGDQMGDALAAAGLPVVGNAVSTVAPYVPEAGIVLGLNEAKNRAEQHPGYHRMLSVVPGTEQYHQRWGR